MGSGIHGVPVLKYCSPYTAPQGPTLGFVFSMLRMGTKYLITHVREEAVAVLRKALPEDNFASGTDDLHKTFKDLYTVGQWPTYIDAINVADEAGLQVVLPLLLYKLRIPAQDVFEGKRRPDGTMAILSQVNQMRLFCGREALARERRTMLRSWLLALPRCVGGRICSAYHQGLYIELLAVDPPTAGMFRPWDRGWDDPALCASCTYDAKFAFLAAQDNLVKRMPAVFRLANWAELKKAAES